MMLQKQILSRSFVAYAGAMLALMALLFAWMQSPAAAAKFEIIGQVEKLEGEVYATRDDIDKKQPLNKGDRIFSEDTILTGTGGKVELKFLDDSALSLGGDAQMRLDRFVYNPDTKDGESSYTVAQGFFRFVSGAIAKKTPGAMEIAAGSTTLSIRGTTGGGDVPPTGGGNFFLESNADGTTGSFDVTSGGETVTMDEAGMTSEVSSPSSPPSRPTRISSGAFKQQFGQLDNFASNGQYDSRTNQELGKEIPEAPATEAEPPTADLEPQETPVEPQPVEPETPEAAEEPQEPAEQEAPQEQGEVTDEPQAEAPATEENPSPATQEPEPQTGEQGAEQANTTSSEGTGTTDAGADNSQEAPKPFEPEPVSNVNPDLPQEYQDLQRDPKEILRKFPDGGPKMAKYVAQAVQQYPEMAGTFSKAASSANPPQAAALGVGASRAARALNVTDPDAAKRVSEEISRSSSKRMRMSYNAVGPSNIAPLPPVESSAVDPKQHPPRHRTKNSFNRKLPNEFNSRMSREPFTLRERNEKGPQTLQQPPQSMEKVTEKLQEKKQVMKPPAGGLEGPTSSPFAPGGVLSTAGASAAFVATEAAEEEATPTSPTK